MLGGTARKADGLQLSPGVGEKHAVFYPYRHDYTLPCQRKTLNTYGKWVFMKLAWSQMHQEGFAEVFQINMLLRGLFNEFAN